MAATANTRAMDLTDMLLFAAPWATLALGVRAGMRLERHRRDRNLDELLDGTDARQR
jgi:hypothetical protein